MEDTFICTAFGKIEINRESCKTEFPAINPQLTCKYSHSSILLTVAKYYETEATKKLPVAK